MAALMTLTAEMKASAKDLSLNVKTMDLITKTKSKYLSLKAKTKVKDMLYCC